MSTDEFDRAIPVINHKEVDLLLMRADQHMAQYEYVSLLGVQIDGLVCGSSQWLGGLAN